VTKILGHISKKDINKYLTSINNEDWVATVDMINPKMFDYTTKEQLIGAFKQMKESGMKMEVDCGEITKVSKIFEEGDNQFCRIDYNAIIFVTLSGDMIEMADQVIENFEAAYGEDRITYDEDENQCIIDASRIMIAATPAGTTDWKYMEYEPTQLALLDKLLPKKVIEKFKL
jgi:hypothetical protein